MKTKTLLCLASLTACIVGIAATLDVGPGREYERIEEALAVAGEGDVIVVHPRGDGGVYVKPVLFVDKPVTIRAAVPHVVLDGAGFVYSGRGRVPRAIVQFEHGASGSVLDGFVLQNARNQTHNGAGVRINQANNITITNCVIRNNDMGIMSNGNAGRGTGAGQVITHCVITKNGALEHKGYSHNLYLGGTSATVRHCEISESAGGHNLKSRAHLLFVEDCVIRHSANRELDIVDGVGDTDIAGSDAVLLRNKIIKHPDCRGNGNVIHFGRDGAAERIGTLHAVSNLIVSAYITPVIDLSSRVEARLEYNTFTGSPKNARLLSLRNQDARGYGTGNEFPENLSLAGYDDKLPARQGDVDQQSEKED